MTAKQYFLKHAIFVLNVQEKDNFELLAALMHYKLNYKTADTNDKTMSVLIDKYVYKSQILSLSDNKELKSKTAVDVDGLKSVQIINSIYAQWLNDMKSKFGDNFMAILQGNR
jgi:hypothetical protein